MALACDLVSGETTRVVGMITRKFLASADIAKGKGVKVTTGTADTVKVATATTASDRIIGVAKSAITSGTYGYIVLEGKVQVDVGSTTVAAGDALTDGTTTSFGKTGTLNTRFGTILGTKDSDNLAWAYFEAGSAKATDLVV